MGNGDMTDDDLLNPMGDPALGIITAGQYSAAHSSPENKAFVAGFTKFAGKRPNPMAESVYDGKTLIYNAIKKTGGDTDGDKLIAAMKGMSFESPAARSPSIRIRATSSRTSISAASSARTANSTISNLRLFRR